MERVGAHAPDEQLPLVARFQRARWTPERAAIDAMKPGDVLTFTREQRHAIITNIRRTQCAYGDRTFTTKNGDWRAAGPFTVTRVK